MKCITCNDFKKCNSIDGWPFYVGCFYVISSGNNLNRTSYLYRGGEKYFCKESIPKRLSWNFLYQVFNPAETDHVQSWVSEEDFPKMFYTLKESRKLKLKKINESRG
jgi:hypothetical protein